MTFSYYISLAARAQRQSFSSSEKAAQARKNGDLMKWEYFSQDSDKAADMAAHYYRQAQKVR